MEYLIRAMPCILSEYPDCELVLFGAEPGMTGSTPYGSVIEEAGVGNAIMIKERVLRKSLPVWIHSSDIVVMPSLREGFGLIAAEVLACGCPVVSTRSGGPEDIIEKGQGILVPPKDADALGDALLHTLEGDGILSSDELSDSARQRFSYENIASRIFDVYEEVCSG